MIAADRRDHQDGIRFLFVELAVRDVGDREVLDDFAALKGEIADLVGLMRRLVGCVGERGCGGERRREREYPRECQHRILPGGCFGREHSERAGPCATAKSCVGIGAMPGYADVTKACVIPTASLTKMSSVSA